MNIFNICRKTAMLIAFGALLLFNQCTDLSEDPYEVITVDEIGDSEEVLSALAAPSYTRLRDVMYGWHGYFDLVEESSDCLVTPWRPFGSWVDGGVYKALHLHTWTSTAPQPNNLWNRVYGALNVVNAAIATTESNPELKGKTSEFKALRAFYYYLLLDNFGNVPLVISNDVGEEELPKQSSRQEVFDFVVSEVNNALPDLSEQVSPATYGTMTKWAALMILAKVYLNAEVYAGTPRWSEAIAAVDQIIAGGKFSLESNYHNNFVTNNEGSAEQIFSIPYDENLGGWFHSHWKTLHVEGFKAFDLTTAWNGSAAIPQFIDTYDPDDDRLNIWIRGPQVTPRGDTLYCTIEPDLRETPLVYTKELGNIDFTREYQGYRNGKYEIKIGSSGPLGNDVPFFRYADALMIKAECLLRTGDPDGAADLVTQLRMRAFEDPAKATVTGSELMQGSSYNYGVYDSGVITDPEGGDDIQYGRFLDELGWEFFGEFHRRQDLIRFGVFTTKSWFSHTPNGDYRALYPIPQGAIDRNPNLEQNPGY
jgi:hypothetical protein